MNIAGLIAYAQRQFGAADWRSVRYAQSELALPYDILPSLSFGGEEPLPALPIFTLRDMVTLGRVGVFTMDDDAYRRSTEGLRRVEDRETSMWLEALRTPNGNWIMSPQIETVELAIYLFAPVVHEPKVVRLATLDTGLRPGGAQIPPSVPTGKCDRGVDDDLNWICLQGSCTGPCEPDGWISGDGPVELTGCSCS